jgi:hypothetical protein
MGWQLPIEKAIKLLEFRGEKLLASTLRDCWLEQEVIDDIENYMNISVSSVRIHAPLDEYEFLRNLDNSKTSLLLELFKEIYSSREVVVNDLEFALEIDNQADEQLVVAIDELKGLMIAVATGKRRIEEANNEYKQRHSEIAKALQSKGIKDPNRFTDLLRWFTRWKSGDLPSYQSRRQFVAELYDPLLRKLQSHDSSVSGIFNEPTGWARVDRCVTQIREQLEQASNEEQFQVVGTLCREALISLAQAVFDATKHPTVDEVEASPTDFKRMIEAYIAELTGDSMAHSRKHARAAFDLANELQHKRTATFRHAALCAEATTAVVNLIAILSGQRDPS